MTKEKIDKSIKRTVKKFNSEEISMKNNAVLIHPSSRFHEMSEV